MPMCPIVSACGTATYNTAKVITKILQHYCGKTSSFVKDGTDFIKKFKHLLINPEDKTSVSFDVSAHFTSFLVPDVLQVINSKISTCINFTNVYKIPTEKCIKLLEFTILNCIFCFNKKFYKQLQGAAIGSPVSPVIANIYMEYFESLAIPTSPTIIKWWFRYVDDVHSATRKDQVNKLQEHLNFIDLHIKFTIELPGTDGLPFLDTVTKPTPNSIEPLKPQSTENPPTQIGAWTTTLTTPFQQNYLLSTPSCTELNRYVLHLNCLQKNGSPSQSPARQLLSSSFFNKANPNKKPSKTQTHPQESL